MRRSEAAPDGRDASDRVERVPPHRRPRSPLALRAAAGACRRAPPLRIVPVDDVALAQHAPDRAPARSGAGAALRRRSDPSAVAHSRRGAERPVAVHAIARPATAPARRLLETLAGAPCAEVDDLLALAQRWWPTRADGRSWHRDGRLRRGCCAAPRFAGAAGGALAAGRRRRPLPPEALQDWPSETL